jgi:hypothetical protein
MITSGSTGYERDRHQKHDHQRHDQVV